jgi:ferredoxin
VTASILTRGYAEGAFRRHAEAIGIHLMISAFCSFRMSNRYTFCAVFGFDLLDASRREHYRRMVRARASCTTCQGKLRPVPRPGRCTRLDLRAGSKAYRDVHD